MNFFVRTDLTADRQSGDAEVSQQFLLADEGATIGNGEWELPSRRSTASPLHTLGGRRPRT
jgi:hypothetical protein